MPVTETGQISIAQQWHQFTQGISEATMSLVSVRLDLFWGRVLCEKIRENVLSDEVRSAEMRLTEVINRSSNLRCVDCGELSSKSSPYCSPYCSQMAGTVRYCRKALEEGRDSDDEFLEGAGMRIIQQAKGGYPAERILPKRLRSQILARDGGTCQQCGEPADQVDHIEGDSADPSNLRALCKRCNWMRAITPSASTDEDREMFAAAFLEVMSALVMRVAAVEPLNACDDWHGWRKLESSTRSLRTEALREIRERLETDFEDVDGYLAHAMAKND